MSSARRSLLTATAAATLLGALWFVPSANASSETPARAQDTTTTQVQTAADTTDTSGVDASGVSGTGIGTQLADTGSFDTTPYVIGGSVFLSLGAGFVVYSVRRERLGF
ncbi:hypothetical protein AB0E88_24710 [Streptomyces sp. NPDC028635]|uniref:hypothetical protein n=1 Tax=Streptomyces sp. NPDC028635 TaxID=3154800 RepID=UPI0033D45755